MFKGPRRPTGNAMKVSSADTSTELSQQIGSKPNKKNKKRRKAKEPDGV